MKAIYQFIIKKIWENIDGLFLTFFITFAISGLVVLKWTGVIPLAMSPQEADKTVNTILNILGIPSLLITVITGTKLAIKFVRSLFS